ncbi:DUF2218 domain-containing protein [Amaricoccus sp.]|uniref:DUF2218 domain-containing protein n=1 Tax=Amaricoccus sp. TaxID=1872485 RepID=UPI001B57F0DB|nr:DUF2218 domain-containing protein [Amaricoccus sp.]MBP7000735.1 DUF2218 domain-containing protein [Amaricoccus sp.]
MTDATETQRAVAEVRTAHAKRYMGQLCKHFAHKVPAELEETSGVVRFPFGTLHARAEDDRLILEVEATPENLARIEEVTASHLVRFAFREEIAIDWRPA